MSWNWSLSLGQRTEKKRVAKKWFSKKYYSSVLNLRDFLADNIGQSFSAFQCIGRTNLSTSLTQDAFRGVFALTGVVASLYIHRTHFKAFAALDTLVLITMNT